jgi:mannose-6-phosphate isomerase-like protein (cupin superfamily)
MTECRMLLEEPEGERRVEMAAGAVYRRGEGVEHNVVNAGDQPMSFIEIEIKPRKTLSRRERVAAKRPGEGLPKPRNA